MRDGMTCLETYLNELEAEIAQNRLQAGGLIAVIQKDNCGGMRPHLDLHQGVKLLVANEDLDLAREILATPQADAAPPWVCLGCVEENESHFEICWNCGKARS